MSNGLISNGGGDTQLAVGHESALLLIQAEVLGAVKADVGEFQAILVVLYREAPLKGFQRIIVNEVPGSVSVIKLSKVIW